MHERPLDLPPVFRAHELAPTQDALALAIEHVVSHGEPAELFWERCDERISAAVTLTPEPPRDVPAALVAVGLVALADALAVLVPPGRAVHTVWPDRIYLNDAMLGGVRLAITPAGQERRAALAILLQRGALADDRHARDGMTSLADEGCTEVSAAAVIGAFARVLLNWSDSWEHQGFAPLRQQWLARARDYRQTVHWRAGQRSAAGTFAGLTDTGDAILRSDAGVQVLHAEAWLGLDDWHGRLRARPSD